MKNKQQISKRLSTPCLHGLVQNKMNPYLVFTFFFGVIAIANLIILTIDGKTLIYEGDAANCYYPGFVYVGNYIREIPNNLIRFQRIPSYDFLLGFGNNVFEVSGIIGDPFNWLSVLFPGSLSVFGYNFCVLFRIYIGGIGVVFWARNHHVERGGVLGAVFYSFCSYSLNLGIHFYNYLTAFSMFPYILAGVDNLIEKGKKYSGILVLGVAVTAMDGFALLWMDTVFFAVYIPLRSYYEIKKRFDNHRAYYVWKVFVECLKHYFLGIGISAPFFLQDLYGHLLSSRSNIEFANSLMLFDRASILNRVKGFISNLFYPEGLGIGIICFSLLLVFLFERNNKELKWILLFVITGHFVLGFHVLMNCFVYSGYAVGRWHYILFCCLAIGMALGWENWYENNAVTKKQLIVILTVIILSYLLFILYPAIKKGLSDSTKQIAYTIITISYVTTILCLCFRPSKSNLFLLIMFVITSLFYSTKDFVNSDIYRNTVKGAFSEMSAKDQANGAFRTDINDHMRMAPLVVGNPGTRSYFSVQNDNLYFFLRDMTCSSSLFGGSVNMGGLDGRKSLEMIMSVGTYSDDEDNTIVHNNYDTLLPIGFAYDSYMLSDEAMRLDPLDRSSNVVKTVYIDEAPKLKIQKKESKQLNFYSWEQIPISVDYTEVEKTGNWVNVDNGNIIYIRFPEGSVTKDEDVEYYLYIGAMTTENWLSVVQFEGKKIRYTPQGEAANTHGEYLIKLPVNDEMIKNKYIALVPEAGRYQFGDFELRRLDTSQYKEDYKKLQRNALYNLIITPDEIKGEIVCEENSILFTSILYDQRWACWIDGKPVESLRADSGFLAVEIEKGEHDIVFEYHNNMKWGSLGIHILSIIVMLLYRNKCRKESLI